MCSLTRFDPAKRSVSQPLQPHTLCARLLVFDKTLVQPDFAVVNCSDHERNFVVKCGGGSLMGNQYSHRVDAEVTFYMYRFSMLFLEVFREQH